MAGSDSFLFDTPVGMFESMSSHENEETEISRPIKAMIKMVQNGYELNYEGKEFISKDLDEGLNMIRSWMEMNEKEMSKKDKA